MISAGHEGAFNDSMSIRGRRTTSRSNRDKRNEKETRWTQIVS